MRLEIIPNLMLTFQGRGLFSVPLISVNGALFFYSLKVKNGNPSQGFIDWNNRTIGVTRSFDLPLEKISITGDLFEKQAKMIKFIENHVNESHESGFNKIYAFELEVEHEPQSQDSLIAYGTIFYEAVGLSGVDHQQFIDNGNCIDFNDTNIKLNLHEAIVEVIPNSDKRLLHDLTRSFIDIASKNSLVPLLNGSNGTIH